MSKITSFVRSNANLLSEEIVKALKDSGLEEKYGVKFRDAGGSFSSTSLSMKLESAVVNEDGRALTKDAEMFKLYSFRYGLTEDNLFQVFADVATGERWKVVGARPRSTKFPILVENMETRKVFKFPAPRVKKAFDAMKEAAC